ncbi:MAG: lactate/malate family dehydrogenase [Christensenellales bacterium]
MSKNKVYENKVVIIGAGHVGSHCALALATQELCKEIILVDINNAKASAHAEDIADALIFPCRHVSVRQGELKECADAAIVIIAIGQPYRQGQTRLDLIDDSIRMIHELINDLRAVDVGGIVITITNPADIVADYVRRGLGLPRERVFSTGTLLDTARLVRILSNKSGVSPSSIQAYVMGEHGASAMIPFSLARIGALDYKAYGIDKKYVLELTRSIGMEIIGGKLSTEFGIGQVSAMLCRCILRDEKQILPLSVLLDGEYGQHDLHAGVPCRVGRGGVESIIELPLTTEEQAMFDNSCDVIRRYQHRAFEIAPLDRRWRSDKSDKR